MKELRHNALSRCSCLVCTKVKYETTTLLIIVIDVTQKYVNEPCLSICLPDRVTDTEILQEELGLNSTMWVHTCSNTKLMSEMSSELIIHKSDESKPAYQIQENKVDYQILIALIKIRAQDNGTRGDHITINTMRKCPEKIHVQMCHHLLQLY